MGGKRSGAARHWRHNAKISVLLEGARDEGQTFNITCTNVRTRNKGKGMLCSPLMPLSQHQSGLMYEVEEHVRAASTQFQD